MSSNVTWDGTVYAIPASGEINWASLSTFLIALGNKAGIAKQQIQAVRTALTTPVTVSATTDYAIATKLTSPGAVTVNLPAGVQGQIFVIVDDTGDAGTNNITINRSGSDTIAGATSLVLNHNRQAVMLAYNATGTDWKILYNTPLSPLTTKGDIATFSTVDARLGVGTDTFVLTADATQTTGLKWAAGTSSTLNAGLVDIGNASNARTATNTSLLGNVKATTTSQTYAVTNATPGVFTISGHGFLTGDKAYVTVTQNGFTANTTYFVHKIDANTFHLSTTYANAVGATYIASSGTTAGVIVSGGLVVQPGPATNRLPTQQAFTSGTGTYTTPTSVAWIRVRMVGGGGGGGGGGTAGTGTNGANGVDTTFGSSLLTAGAGGGGARLGTGQGPGGTATVNSPAAGIGLTGTNGGAGTASTVTGIKNLGGYGGNSAFGGGGSPGTDALAAIDGIANTGGGGGGGGTSVSASAVAAGDGGGAGAFIDAIIGSPAATYAYAVGTGGALGSAGTSGTAGSAGGSGYIIVEEHYF